MRFLDEDPWERLRTLKKYLKKTPLQMLFRGQNILGYRHYADDMVYEFVNRAVDNGIDIIRVFDALNDSRNLEAAVKAGKDTKSVHVQGAMVYTVSPIHTLESFTKGAVELQEMGVDSLCIKDMSGLLAPYDAYNLVRMLKKHLTVPTDLRQETSYMNRRWRRPSTQQHDNRFHPSLPGRGSSDLYAYALPQWTDVRRAVQFP
ncbi:HMGL-like protein [Anaeroglobus geminatus F0357]|uniref:HMGL-like protein n=1 Tax=Anaeroglobus geminatus F0357 TaxID=861450 RepID=G9YGS2_9FIRM|nr:HMGL-like protein [Anaeroglobus geminatus F0357]